MEGAVASLTRRTLYQAISSTAALNRNPVPPSSGTPLVRLKLLHLVRPEAAHGVRISAEPGQRFGLSVWSKNSNPLKPLNQ